MIGEQVVMVYEQDCVHPFLVTERKNVPDDPATPALNTIAGEFCPEAMAQLPSSLSSLQAYESAFITDVFKVFPVEPHNGFFTGGLIRHVKSTTTGATTTSTFLLQPLASVIITV